MPMKRDYIDFQERSVAMAYLITFKCYGTGLHGDDRGSADRRYFNRFGTPKIAPDAEKRKRKAGLLKDEPFVLAAAERRVVEKAIKEVCSVRGYVLFTSNVRTNHVHLVVSNNGKPERLMDTFKAYSTRALRASGLLASDRKTWSRHGSTGYLGRIIK